MPSVSVIVPVYGVEPYLRKCLESIALQTLEDIEVIVIDDGSPDGCAAIIDEFSERDHRFCAIHKKNAGVSAARNDGLARAVGEYIFFCDSDDWLPPHALAALFEAAKLNDVDVVVGDYIESSRSGERTLKMFSKPFCTSNTTSIELVQKAIFNKGRANYHCIDFDFTRGLGAPWHHLIRRDLIVGNSIAFNMRVGGLFDDGLFLLNVFEHVGSMSYIQVPTYYYRIVDSSITHGFKPDLLNRYQVVYSEIEKFIAAHSKSEEFCRAYYVRVYAYLNKAMSAYFLNPANSASESQRYAEYNNTLDTYPYNQAIALLDASALGYFRSRLLVFLLKHNLRRFYWVLKKISAKEA